MDGISGITARISQIQQRIAALTQPNAAQPEEAASTAAPNFGVSLRAAQGSPASTALPGGPAGITVPDASLGPLPTLPVSPGASDIVPIPSSGTGNYAALIEKYAAQNHLEPGLVKAVIQTESGGNPRSVSKAGAMGLMQLMPDNVKEAGLSDPFDPEQNIAAGTKQLSGLLSQFHGDLDLALAGYNAGPGNVRKYGGVPPFTETQNYIQRVRAAMAK